MKVVLAVLFLLFSDLVLTTRVSAADANVALDTPRSGWRTGSDEGAEFSQEVNYPASSVNSAAGQGDSARIKGRIAAHPKNTQAPAQLIVNGVVMPLKVNDDGSFDRPFIFPAGSNSVEVRAPNGEQTRRVQFYNLGQGVTPAKLRVVLSWDSDNTDLDLHVISPDGGHAWYGGRIQGNGGALDVDVTTGYGPEIFAAPSPIKGQYLVYVNYYGGGYHGDEDTYQAAQALTTARITIISEEGTPDEKQETTLVPMRAPGELTLVKRFSYP